MEASRLTRLGWLAACLRVQWPKSSARQSLTRFSLCSRHNSPCTPCPFKTTSMSYRQIWCNNALSARTGSCLDYSSFTSSSSTKERRTTSVSMTSSSSYKSLKAPHLRIKIEKRSIKAFLAIKQPLMSRSWVPTWPRDSSLNKHRCLQRHSWTIATSSTKSWNASLEARETSASH